MASLGKCPECERTDLRKCTDCGHVYCPRCDGGQSGCPECGCKTYRYTDA